MRRRFLMGTRRELPADFTRLSYIENTGGAYINSGYLYRGNTQPSRIVAEFEYTDTSANGYLFGAARNTNNAYMLSLHADANRGKLAFTRIGETGSGIRFTDIDHDRHRFEYVYQEGVYFDGVLQQSTVDAANTNITIPIGSNSIGIFTALRANAPYANALARIYAFQIWDDTGLTFNCIPAQRKSDGVIGMYETVTRTFLTNAGTGEFLGG